MNADRYFPHLALGDKSSCTWRYLRKDVPHRWYVDLRGPGVGFLSRDEACLLYNTAALFRGQRGLEIGCWRGWSACHTAMGGVHLDVIDPILGRRDFHASVEGSLQAAGVRNRVNLVAGMSPPKVHELAAQHGRPWSFFFIDGNHDAPHPLQDTIACEAHAADDALMLFHDLASPEAAEGLDYLKGKGWHTRIYQTMQIMGAAWRGNITPLRHQPDPDVAWTMPTHLKQHDVSR